jgi:hypothetical protein
MENISTFFFFSPQPFPSISLPAFSSILAVIQCLAKVSLTESSLVAYVFKEWSAHVM